MSCNLSRVNHVREQNSQVTPLTIPCGAPRQGICCRQHGSRFRDAWNIGGRTSRVADSPHYRTGIGARKATRIRRRNSPGPDSQLRRSRSASWGNDFAAPMRIARSLLVYAPPGWTCWDDCSAAQVSDVVPDPPSNRDLWLRLAPGVKPLTSARNVIATGSGISSSQVCSGNADGNPVLQPDGHAICFKETNNHCAQPVRIPYPDPRTSLETHLRYISHLKTPYDSYLGVLGGSLHHHCGGPLGRRFYSPQLPTITARRSSQTDKSRLDRR